MDSSSVIRLSSSPFRIAHSSLRATNRTHNPLSLSLSSSSTSASRDNPRKKPPELEAAGAGAKRGAALDEAAYEAERLRLDAEARESMAEASEREGAEEDPKAWKWVIRKRVWDFMEARDVAQNPRPVHHRIPNFVGASAAASKVKNANFIRLLIPFHFAICYRVENFRFCSSSDLGETKNGSLDWFIMLCV